MLPAVFKATARADVTTPLNKFLVARYGKVRPPAACGRDRPAVPPPHCRTLRDAARSLAVPQEEAAKHAPAVDAFAALRNDVAAVIQANDGGRETLLRCDSGCARAGSAGLRWYL
jgi:hypothetical protein